jgi:hypothetical protein
MCKAVNADLNKGAIVSYELASFVFYYPSSNYWVASSTEMSLPDLLICKGGRVSRRETTNEIPVNCVRLVDPSKRDILAEADFLLGVTPMENPGQHKYIRRSLRFIYRDGWKKGNAQ